MTVLVYECTRDAHPSWNFSKSCPRGIAYETPTHFVHLYGQRVGTCTISSGLTITEGKICTLREWVVSRFGAQNIEETNLPVGQCVSNVWRPGLYYNEDVLQSLGASLPDVRQAQRSIVSLFRKLDEILNYIEPSQHGLLSFGHRTRELLILACTDIEDQWVRMLRLAGVTKSRLNTTDYVQLRKPLHLAEFRMLMPAYPEIAIEPFAGWTEDQPTASLPWYEAYNKTKHDKTNHLMDATLQMCIDAVAANIAMFSARFGPHFLIEGQGSTSSQFNELFKIELSDPDFKTFYAPLIDTSAFGGALQYLDSRNLTLPRDRLPLVL